MSMERRVHLGEPTLTRQSTGMDIIVQKAPKAGFVMPTSHPITVAMIDDHTLFRTALVNMINAIEGYQVVLEAGNGREFVRAMDNSPEFAIAIVDLYMPVMDGYATLQWLRSHKPNIRALALTFDDSEEARVKALRAGACGFLLKDADWSEFTQALQEVMAVGHYHGNGTRGLPIDGGDLRTRYERTRAKVLAQLSEREREFVVLSCDPMEYTYDQIAGHMQVHRRTVDGYRESVFHKLNVKTRGGLVLSAVKWGLAQV